MHCGRQCQQTSPATGRCLPKERRLVIWAHDAAHYDHSHGFGRSEIEILRVSGSSRPNSVAGAIAALLRNEGEVEVQAIGPHAVNQAVKAIAIARAYIQADGLGLRTVPSFVKLELHEEERTAVRFAVESYPDP